MKIIENSIFEEQYRVVAVESDQLLIRGIISGKVLAIACPPETSPTLSDYPPGTLIVLSDPTSGPLN